MGKWTQICREFKGFDHSKTAILNMICSDNDIVKKSLIVSFTSRKVLIQKKEIETSRIFKPIY